MVVGEFFMETSMFMKRKMVIMGVMSFMNMSMKAPVSEKYQNMNTSQPM